jgi:hypothetical protein
MTIFTSGIWLSRPVSNEEAKRWLSGKGVDLRLFRAVQVHADLCGGVLDIHELIENLHHHTDRYSRIQLMFTDWRGTAQHEHRTLLAYCRKGDSTGAVEYLQRRITSAGRALTDFLIARRDARASGNPQELFTDKSATEG